jgi:hypothetical protein
MLQIALVTTMLLQAPAPGIVRTVDVTALTKKGARVDDLPAAEVGVVENGVAREVVRVQRDPRPLALVVIVDDSLATGSGFRFDVIDAVEGFLKGMPSGTRYCLWLTADRPARVVEWSEQPTDAGHALRRTPQRGANTFIDAVAEASRDVAKREGDRTAVVAITGSGPEMSHRDKTRAVDEALPHAERFYVAQIREGEEPFERLEAQAYVIDRLTRESGGALEDTLTSVGLAKALDRIAAALLSQYRIAYRTEPDLKQRKLEITLANPDLRAKIAPERGSAR